jgi:hypothetical protein
MEGMPTSMGGFKDHPMYAHFPSACSPLTHAQVRAGAAFDTGADVTPATAAYA